MTVEIIRIFNECRVVFEAQYISIRPHIFLKNAERLLRTTYTSNKKVNEDRSSFDFCTFDLPSLVTRIKTKIGLKMDDAMEIFIQPSHRK